MSDSDITIIGGLTRDPELKFLNNGQAAVKFSVAVEKRWLNKATNEWDKKVSFFDVIQYGKPAENAAATLVKGSRVVVKGALEQRSWETTEGEKKYVVEINAEEVGLGLRFGTALYAKSDSAGSGATRAPAAATYAEEPF